jgi:hypothetical protein
MHGSNAQSRLESRWNAGLKSASNAQSGKSLTILRRMVRRISNPRSISGQAIVHRAKIRHGHPIQLLVKDV